MGALRDASAAQDDGPLASINVIPFVDIVLVLLVIFMLTSAAIVRATMKVDLPKAAAGGATVESTVNLVLTRDGELILNGKPATTPEAVSIVQGESRKNPKLQAVIAADKSVPYGRVMELVDLVKQNGVTSFALDVQRVAPAPQLTPTP